MKSERRWVIVGVHGLYTGQWLLRRTAIREHIMAIHGVKDPQPYHAALSDEERALWDKCHRNGDRVLHATVTYEDRGVPTTWPTSENPSSESEPIPSQNPSPTT